MSQDTSSPAGTLIVLVVQKDVVFRILIDLHFSGFEFPCWNLLGKQYIQFFIGTALMSKAIRSQVKNL